MIESAWKRDGSAEKLGQRGPRGNQPHGAKCSPSPSDRKTAICPRVSGASGQKLPPPQPLVIPERGEGLDEPEERMAGRHVGERGHGGRGTHLEGVEDAGGEEADARRGPRPETISSA